MQKKNKYKQKQLSDKQRKQLAAYKRKKRKSIGEVVVKADRKNLASRLHLWGTLIIISGLLQLLLSIAMLIVMHELFLISAIGIFFGIIHVVIGCVVFTKISYNTLLFLGIFIIVSSVLSINCFGIILLIIGIIMVVDAAKAISLNLDKNLVVKGKSK